MCILHCRQSSVGTCLIPGHQTRDASAGVAAQEHGESAHLPIHPVAGTVPTQLRNTLDIPEPLPNPRCASHLSSVFTKAQRRLEEEREKKLEKERLQQEQVKAAAESVCFAIWTAVRAVLATLLLQLLTYNYYRMAKLP
jgi:hypothetical protein